MPRERGGERLLPSVLPPPRIPSRQTVGLGPALQHPDGAVLFRIGRESVTDGYVGTGNTMCLLRLSVSRCSAKYLKLRSREGVNLRNLSDIFFLPSPSRFFFFFSFLLMELGVHVPTTSTTKFCQSQMRLGQVLFLRQMGGL